MPHLWVPQARGAWAPFALGDVPLDLCAGGEPVAGRPARAACTSAWLEPLAGGERWVLIAGCAADVRVNGLPLPAGLRALQDRDEIRIANRGSLFFSSERPARIEPHPRGAARFCPRCKGALEPGEPAVRCPGCDLWYHQRDGHPCWAYAPACICGHPTTLDGSFRWRPEEL